MNGRAWTAEEMEVIKNEFPFHATSYIAEKLNRTCSAVSGQARDMGIKKDKSYINPSYIKKGEQRGLQSQFKKGNVPANKGVKMSEEVYQRVSKSFFKKGNKPANYKGDGYEYVNIQGYVIIIHEGKQVFKNRLLWEQNYGAIPNDMVVSFKDGNKQNVFIENLELRTMQENMAKNTIARFPEELRSAIKLLSKLKKKIDEKQD